MNSFKNTSLIVGGGFVGLTLAARLLKDKNMSIVLVDSDSNKIINFNKNLFGVVEPGLTEVLSEAMIANRLKFDTGVPNSKFNLMFICISTPKNQLLEKNVGILCQIFDKYSETLSASASIFLRSTVQIGTTSRLNSYIQSSRRNDINVFYAPERTAEGVALKELDTLPQILGSAKKNEIIKGENILSSLNFKVLTVANSESAEFVKLMCNIWRDSIFAISNDLAIIGESLNLDTFELIDKANFEYPRAQISRPGPVNGPCLSKDTYILLQSLPDFLQKNRLIESARILNESLEEIAFNKVLSFTYGKSKNFRVLFLGAAFKGKPKTNDFRESFTKNLLEKLLQTKLEMDFSVWDPNLAPNDLFEYSRFYKSNFDNDNYDIIIIGNNSDAVSSEEVRDYLNHLANDSLIVDMWGVIRNSDFIQAKFYQFGSSTRI